MAGGGHVGGMYGEQVIALQVNDGMAENIAQRIVRSGGGAVDGGKLPVQQDEHGTQRRNQRFEKALVQWQRSIKKYCENTNLCQVNGKYETSM